MNSKGFLEAGCVLYVNGRRNFAALKLDDGTELSLLGLLVAGIRSG